MALWEDVRLLEESRAALAVELDQANAALAEARVDLGVADQSIDALEGEVARLHEVRVGLEAEVARLTQLLNGTPPPEPEPEVGETAGVDGMKAAHGTFLRIGAEQVENFESIEADLGRRLNWCMVSLSMIDIAGYMQIALGNADALWRPSQPQRKPPDPGGVWHERPDVHLDAIIPTITAVGSVDDTYRAMRAREVVAGQHDSKFRRIFELAAPFQVDWRLGQEMDIPDGHPGAMLGMDESLHREMWDHIYALGKSIAPHHIFAWQGNGPFQLPLDHPWLTGKYPKLKGDSRQVWEYAKPTTYDAIGQNLYAGIPGTGWGDSPEEHHRLMRGLSDIGKAEGKPVKCPEIGVFFRRTRTATPWTLSAGQKQAVRDWWLGVCTIVAEAPPADQPGGWRSFSYFEHEIRFSLRHNARDIYEDTYVPSVGG